MCLRGFVLRSETFIHNVFNGLHLLEMNKGRNFDFAYEYEGCLNMNASSFITFFTYMLRQNRIRFYKGLYVTFELAPDLKKIQYTYLIIAL